MKRYVVAVVCLAVLGLVACTSGSERSAGNVTSSWRIIGSGTLSGCPKQTREACGKDYAWVAWNAPTTGGACYSFAIGRITKDTGHRLTAGQHQFCDLATKHGGVPANALLMKEVSLGRAGTLVYGGVAKGPRSLTVKYDDDQTSAVHVFNGGVAIGVPTGHRLVLIKGTFDHGVVAYCTPTRQHEYSCGRSPPGVTSEPDATTTSAP